MITFRHKGSFKNTIKYLTKLQNIDSILHTYGKKGVEMLSMVTPKKTGKTAASWSYEILSTSKGASLYWKNSNMTGKTPIVILLRYGYATKSGRYIAGRDFISPVMVKLAKDLDAAIRKELDKI